MDGQSSRPKDEPFGDEGFVLPKFDPIFENILGLAMWVLFLNFFKKMMMPLAKQNIYVPSREVMLLCLFFEGDL